jgi:hypothetical protein
VPHLDGLVGAILVRSTVMIETMRAAPRALPAGLQAAETNAHRLARHPEAWQEHAGEWLCVVGGRLVVAEQDQSAFAAKVALLGASDGALILRIPTRNEVDAAHPTPHTW